MSFDKIYTDINNGKYAPIYFLMGDEPYYIDKISDLLSQKVLSDDEKAFNESILYGKDIDASMVINTAKRYPMMSKYQLVIVREAQYMKSIDDLVYYASQPLHSTVLVINYKNKKLDKRKKLYKEIDRNGIVFESKKIYEDKVPAWITGYLKEKGYSIHPPAAILLTEFLGSNLEKIEMEIEKLIITLADGENMITNSHIEENIGISKDFNNIELQNALVKKDTLKAYRIVKYFAENQKNNPIVLTIVSLYFFFNKVLLYALLKDKSRQSVVDNLKINPYFIKTYQEAYRAFPPKKTVKILSLLREYDMKSKGVNNVSTPPGELLKELVSKIISI